MNRPTVSRRQLTSLLLLSLLLVWAPPTAQARTAARSWKPSFKERQYTHVEVEKKTQTAVGYAAAGDLVDCGGVQAIYKGEAKLVCKYKAGVTWVNGVVAGLSLSEIKAPVRLKLLKKHRRTLQYFTLDDTVTLTPRLVKALIRVTASRVVVHVNMFRESLPLLKALRGLKGRLYGLGLLQQGGTLDVREVARFRQLRAIKLDGPPYKLQHLDSLKACAHLRELDLSFKRFDGGDLAFLKKRPNLQFLHLDNTAVVDGDLAVLAHLTKLRQLTFGSPKLTRRTLKRLAKLPRLTTLHIDEVKADDASLRIIGRLKRLRSLQVDAAAAADKGLAALGALTGLTRLEIAGPFSDRGIAVFARFSRLEYLILKSAKLKGAGLAALAKLNKLRSLFLAGGGLGAGALRLLGRASALRSLSVELRAAGATPADVRALAQVKSLTYLSLKLEGKTQPRLDLAPLARLKQLRRLSLAGFRLTPRAARSLGKLRQIHYLSLLGPDLGDAALAPLQALVTLQHLTLMSTGTPKVRPGDKALAMIGRLRGLKILNLTGRFTDRGLAHLAKPPKLKRLTLTQVGKTTSARGLQALARAKALTYLSLSGIRLGAKHIKALSRLRRIETLNVSDMKYTGAGIGALRRARRLKELNVSFTQFTNAALMQAARIKSLRKIDVTETKVTDKGVARFRKRRPDCVVENPKMEPPPGLDEPDDEDEPHYDPYSPYGPSGP